jgi:hypothetical protein
LFRPEAAHVVFDQSLRFAASHHRVVKQPGNRAADPKQSYAKNISHAARIVMTSKTSDAAAKSANLIMTLLMSAWTRLWAILRARP